MPDAMAAWTPARPWPTSATRQRRLEASVPVDAALREQREEERVERRVSLMARDPGQALLPAGEARGACGVALDQRQVELVGLQSPV
jgi:hypothetical protein